MYSLASRAMEGYQNRCWRNCNERLLPGWQVNLEAWAQCRTSERISSGDEQLFW